MEGLGQRKNEHIELAKKAQVGKHRLNHQFNYEPLLGTLPQRDQYYQRDLSFLGKKIRAPLWVSSMTGGTQQASVINQRLAQVCAEFGLGMGLGSCRALLEWDAPSKSSLFESFHLRPLMGEELPLMGNVGIAQVENLVRDRAWDKLNLLVEQLCLDGLFVHINPLQEWIQREGDRIERPPLETLEELGEHINFPLGIKGIGQGMGPESLEAAMALPLEVIEFGAFGGTNFSALETIRKSSGQDQESLEDLKELVCVGHCAEEMVAQLNSILGRRDFPPSSRPEFIISGGVSSFLHGWGLLQSLRGRGVYGQAYPLLVRAQKSYKELSSYVKTQLQGLELASRYLVSKEK